MGSYKRLVYLDHALQAVSKHYRSDMPKRDLDMLVATRRRLKSMPTVDAVKVVRCKACQNSADDAWPKGKVWCRKMCRYMPEGGHCSYGQEECLSEESA